MKPKTFLAFLLLLPAFQASAQNPTPNSPQTVTSPNGEYTLQTDTKGNFEIVNSQGQVQGPPITPLRTNYESTKNVWSPDSTKVALIAMRPNLRDLYLLGIINNYTVPIPPSQDLRQMVITKVSSTLQTDPNAYKFFRIGPFQATWINSNQLQIQDQYSLALPMNFQAGGVPDIRDCIFSYVFDVTNPILQNLQLLTVRKSPYSN